MTGLLEGKTAIVAGGGRGMGESVSLLFAAEGASVVVVDKVGERAERVSQQIVAGGGRAIPLVLNLRGEDAFPSTEVLRTLLLSLLVLGLWALIGLGLGILIPNQVAALMTTVFGVASPSSRAARLGVSPRANCSRLVPLPISPTTTRPSPSWRRARSRSCACFRSSSPT